VSGVVERVLRSAKRIAVVGCSTDPTRHAHRIPEYLQSSGYTVIPVHPSADRILGEKAYRSLAEVPGPIDLVDVFRPSAETPAVVQAAIDAGAKALWLQLGIASAEARHIATAAGIDYVEDRCIMVEHRKLRPRPGEPLEGPRPKARHVDDSP